MADEFAFEDFPAGEVVEYGGVEVSAEDIVAFAREFDPQPFHLFDEAARKATGGLIASGWHTTALLHRMNCDGFLARAMVVMEHGIDEVRWARPVRPGDRLRLRRSTLHVDPAVGEVEFLYEIVNQDDVVAMKQRSRLRLSRRGERTG